MSPKVDLQSGAEALAFVFPGVGVRPCGYERGFFERHRAAMAPIMDEASTSAGVDLLVGLDGGSAALSELQGQLFTFAFNCAVAAAFREGGRSPSLMAGHSLGIYSALYASGALASLGDGLSIVEAAYRIVNEASAGLEAAMAVIVGLGRAEVDELLDEERGGSTARRVNANNDTTMILAGLKADLERALERARARDALKARLLPVTSPYHHPELLRGASATFEEELRRYRWRRPSCPIVSSIDQRLLVEPEALLDLTARNITTPIDWERVVGALVEAGVTTALECGAGLSLTQNGRLMGRSPVFVNVKNASRRLGL